MTRLRDDRGAVTAELAVALPAVVLLVAVVLVTVAAGVAQLRCQDAARTGARLAAVGAAEGEVRAAVRRVAGDDVAVALHRDGEWVEVEVGAGVDGSWFAGGLIPVRAAATAWVEP